MKNLIKIFQEEDNIGANELSLRIAIALGNRESPQKPKRKINSPTPLESITEEKHQNDKIKTILETSTLPKYARKDDARKSKSVHLNSKFKSSPDQSTSQMKLFKIKLPSNALFQTPIKNSRTNLNLEMNLKRSQNLINPRYGTIETRHSSNMLNSTTRTSYRINTELNRFRSKSNGKKITIANPENKDETVTLTGTEENHKLYMQLNDILTVEDDAKSCRFSVLFFELCSSNVNLNLFKQFHRVVKS